MSNAAHAESLDHEVYHRPLAVRPEFEFRPTPDNYRETYEGPGRLPDRIKVWRVQNSPKGSALASALGFLDSPDAEILVVGFNLLKHYGDIGIGRQGNFLQWGYGDPPSQMTEAGRRLFLNCIHYIHRFDDKAPLVRERVNHRRNALSWAAYLAIAAADQKSRVQRVFPKEIWDKYQDDAAGLLAYYKTNLELVYWDGVYYVDEELKSLGVDSNRKVETLERLFELQKDPARREIAQRLLDRYTDGHTTFDLQNGRDRIYFSDVGGHRFFVVPEGYLIGPNTRTATSLSR
jgi:hypothetical protein